MKFSTTAALIFAASTTSAFGFSPATHSSFVSKSSVIDRSFSKNLSLPKQMSKRKSTSISMSYSVAVVGATGAVGKEIISCLNKSSLDVSKLRIFGSQRSAGSKRDAGKFGEVEVELFDVAKARECDVVFLAVSGDFALEHAKALSEGEDGAVVIDNSVRYIHIMIELLSLFKCISHYLTLNLRIQSAFRYDKDIPLVVPEINAEKTKGAKLIANPNCTTAIGLMALWPLHKLFKLKSVIMSVSQLHFDIISFILVFFSFTD